jgi:hypothetical protein
VEDIQEHRYADEARRKSVARLLRSFDMAPTSVMIADAVIKRVDDDGTNPRQEHELWH